MPPQGKIPKVLPVTPKTPSARLLVAEGGKMQPTPKTPRMPKAPRMIAKRIKTGRR